MTNGRFLAVAALIILALCAALLLERDNECQQKGGRVCLPNPMSNTRW